VNAGHLVESGEVRLLMDCGSGVVHRLATLGADWFGITHVALTHFDPDHTLDLVTLIYAWRYGALPWRTAPVELIGPTGTERLLTALAELYGRSVRAPGFPLTVREISPGEHLSLSPHVTLEAFKVPHTGESVAYSVRSRNRRIVYTGDTGASAPLGEWARGCDILLAECSLTEALAIPSHLTPERCAVLAESAAPGLLALTHFYPVFEHVDIRAVIAERYGGPIVLAEDGWNTEIEDN
jgi:ribonuclease BN (tRNA processing enzyme)